MSLLLFSLSKIFITFEFLPYPENRVPSTTTLHRQQQPSTAPLILLHLFLISIHLHYFISTTVRGRSPPIDDLLSGWSNPSICQISPLLSLKSASPYPASPCPSPTLGPSLDLFFVTTTSTKSACFLVLQSNHGKDEGFPNQEATPPLLQHDLPQTRK